MPLDTSHAATGRHLVGYRDAIAIMAATPAALDAILSAIPDHLLDQRPVADEWSVGEILLHMQAADRLLLERVKAMIATDSAPSHRADEAGAATPDGRELLAQWRDARQASLVCVHGLAPDDLDHGAVLPRYGRISVEQQVSEWAYHDLEHLRQLLANVQALLYPAIGGFTALYAAPYPALADVSSESRPSAS